MHELMSPPFDAAEDKDYNKNNCETARQLFASQPGVTGQILVRTWEVHSMDNATWCLRSPLPSKVGNFAMLLAMRPASSSVSTFAI